MLALAQFKNPKSKANLAFSFCFSWLKIFKTLLKIDFSSFSNLFINSCFFSCSISSSFSCVSLFLSLHFSLPIPSFFCSGGNSLSLFIISFISCFASFPDAFCFFKKFSIILAYFNFLLLFRLKFLKFLLFPYYK